MNLPILASFLVCLVWSFVWTYIGLYKNLDMGVILLVGFTVSLALSILANWAFRREP